MSIIYILIIIFHIIGVILTPILFIKWHKVNEWDFTTGDIIPLIFFSLIIPWFAILRMLPDFIKDKVIFKFSKNK